MLRDKLKEVLRRLEKSIHHLKILDDFFIVNEPEYKRMEQKLESLGDGYTQFCRELYYGGDKSQGGEPKGSRQFILSDIFQYMLTGRMIYRASKNKEFKKSFIKVSMCLVNEWLIMDCLGAKEALDKRRALMDALKEGLGDDIWENKDDYHIKKFNNTYEYEGDLIPKPPNLNPPSSSILSGHDSLFPKIRGGPIEVLIYLYLIQRNLGFVVSMLTQQVFLSGNNTTVPPDIFLFRKKGEIIGLEFGTGKEEQSADFSLITGIPTTSVALIDDQPFRCDACGRWIIYCNRIIDKYSEYGIPKDNNHTINCTSCPEFKGGKCPDIICKTDKINRYGKEREARYHFNCLTTKEKKDILRDKKLRDKSLVAYYPLVDGLENLTEET